MAKVERPADMFMNFAGIASRTHPTAGDDLQETTFPTGLSVRGALIWLVHLIEWHPATLTANNTITRCALSTKQGLTVMPEINDGGTLARFDDRIEGALAAGAVRTDLPLRQIFFPPIPIGTPALSVYINNAQDHADSDDKAAPLRIGYTTAPLDSKTYLEIAETWGW